MNARRWAAVLALLCGACDRASERDTAGDGPALEKAARAAGLVRDTDSAAGVFAAGEDRVCLTRREGAGTRYRIGVSVDFGDGQRCVARGTAQGGLSVDLDPDCAFAVALDGERMTFPATLPAGCARLCQGRATLEALSVERLSEATGEAARLRGADGKLLCED